MPLVIFIFAFATIAQFYHEYAPVLGSGLAE